MVFEYKDRVDYRDTDTMGVVHHSVYLNYLERARIEWLREQNMSYKVLEGQGLYLPVYRADLKYKSSLRFDDEFSVRLWISGLSNAKICISHEILSGLVQIATADIELVLCRKNEKGVMLPIRIPEEWKGKPQWQTPKE